MHFILKLQKSLYPVFTLLLCSCLVPGGYFGVGENAQKKPPLGARYPSTWNHNVVAGYQLIMSHYFRSVTDLTVDLPLKPLSEVSRIQLPVWIVLSKLE